MIIKNLDGSVIFEGTKLNDADLSDADLSDAKLVDADLSDAKLVDADLSGADLRRAKLRGADLSGADLSGAKFDGLQIPRIDALNRQILTQIDLGGELDMSIWHTCETTHCRAGWIVYLAGDRGRALEKELDTNAAAALISAASGCPRVPDWYASDDSALRDIRELAARGL